MNPEPKFDGLILYGPPASGKSTLAAELEVRGRFHRYRLLRSGPASASYRPFSPELSTIWETEKYGRTYGIDIAGFDDIPNHACVIVELGEPAAVTAIKNLKISWIVVYLWCPREVAKERMIERGDDVEERLAAWDSTAHIMADLRFDTAKTREK